MIPVGQGGPRRRAEPMLVWPSNNIQGGFPPASMGALSPTKGLSHFKLINVHDDDY